MSFEVFTVVYLGMRVMQYFLSKRREPLTQLLSVIFQKTFIDTVGRIAMWTQLYRNSYKAPCPLRTLS
jgi:hypothetical protein